MAPRRRQVPGQKYILMDESRTILRMELYGSFGLGKPRRRVDPGVYDRQADDPNWSSSASESWAYHRDALEMAGYTFWQIESQRARLRAALAWNSSSLRVARDLIRRNTKR